LRVQFVSALFREANKNNEDQHPEESDEELDCYELEQLRTTALRDFPDNLEQGFQLLLREKTSREEKLERSDMEPKRPMGAYFLWLADKRKSHEGEIGKKEANEWCKQWQAINQIAKRPFIDCHERLQCLYQKELAEFRQKGRYRVQRE